VAATHRHNMLLSALLFSFQIAVVNNGRSSPRLNTINFMARCCAGVMLESAFARIRPEDSAQSRRRKHEESQRIKARVVENVVY
jgi:hypothetical protein